MKYWKTVYYWSQALNHSIIPYDLVLYLEAKRIWLLNIDLNESVLKHETLNCTQNIFLRVKKWDFYLNFFKL
jgi:hypothetical protein